MIMKMDKNGNNGWKTNFLPEENKFQHFRQGLNGTSITAERFQRIGGARRVLREEHVEAGQGKPLLGLGQLCIAVYVIYCSGILFYYHLVFRESHVQNYNPVLVDCAILKQHLGMPSGMFGG